jgi:hypothetical protein
MATSETITVQHPYAEVFRTLVGVLPQHKMQVVNTDEANGIIYVKTGIGMRTWGENITIRLGSRDGGATTEMVIDSNLKFGLAAWGKHDTNYATITEALQTAFASPPPPPAPPQSPPTYPPPPQA